MEFCILLGYLNEYFLPDFASFCLMINNTSVSLGGIYREGRETFRSSVVKSRWRIDLTLAVRNGPSGELRFVMKMTFLQTKWNFLT